MDPLFRGGDGDPVLRGVERVRPAAHRGRDDGAHGGEPAALRRDLQHEVVRGDSHHSILKQGRPVPREDPQDTYHRGISRLPGSKHICRSKPMYPDTK